jgi:hypothetical protein
VYAFCSNISPISVSFRSGEYEETKMAECCVVLWQNWKVSESVKKSWNAFMNSSINKWHGIRCISINMADIDHTRQYIKFIYLLFLFSISVWCCCCWLDLETVGLAFLQCRGILVFRFVFPPLCMYYTTTRAMHELCRI